MDISLNKLLEKYHQSHDLAWVEDQNKIYYSLIQKNYPGPSSAAVKLIQGIFDQFIDHSFFILRNRIFTTAIENELDRSIVKLAAKRISFNVHQAPVASKGLVQIMKDTDLLVSAHLEKPIVQLPTQVQSHEQAATFIQNLALQVPRGEVLHDINRPIGAILTDGNGKILEYSTNSNMKNKTLHAEVVLMQDYYRQSAALLPSCSKIYVTLKPCKMCAAMIHKMMPAENSIEVYYLENDPGALAQNTILEKNSVLKKLHSLER
ncbi:MAG: hypothetical protein BroJett040_19160 [Oligoflexia bacterium]|nr:MAG: hypothetical protein BroJett040_19160 [Oligoflexia bacterium]